MEAEVSSETLPELEQFDEKDFVILRDGELYVRKGDYKPNNEENKKFKEIIFRSGREFKNKDFSPIGDLAHVVTFEEDCTFIDCKFTFDRYSKLQFGDRAKLNKCTVLALQSYGVYSTIDGCELGAPYYERHPKEKIPLPYVNTNIGVLIMSTKIYTPMYTGRCGIFQDVVFHNSFVIGPESKLYDCSFKRHKSILENNNRGEIGTGSYIGSGTILDRVFIDSNCTVASSAIIGDYNEFADNVTIYVTRDPLTIKHCRFGFSGSVKFALSADEKPPEGETPLHNSNGSVVFQNCVIAKSIEAIDPIDFHFNNCNGEDNRWASVTTLWSRTRCLKDGTEIRSTFCHLTLHNYDLVQAALKRKGESVETTLKNIGMVLVKTDGNVSVNGEEPAMPKEFMDSFIKPSESLPKPHVTRVKPWRIRLVTFIAKLLKVNMKVTK